jgi:hypothetical protein
LGLGPEAIPLILQDLQERNTWWFPALEALTRQRPVVRDNTNPEQLKKAWLRWGVQHGYLSAPA